MSIRKCCFASFLVIASAAGVLVPTWILGQTTGQGQGEREMNVSKSGWEGVQEAINKGLPKTGIEKLEPIIENAKKSKDYPEAIKAIAMKIALEGNIQGNRPEEKIVRLEEEIEKAPAEMKPMMQSVLANWYWHFFQQNRWRFMQRTQTSEPMSDDINTWDLARILEEVSKHFDKALENERQLKSTPIADYDKLLEKGNAPDDLRPTLWDFVVYDALDFYQAAEQAGSRAEDAFDLMADSPVFSSVEDFLAWQPQTEDKSSATLKAITLYQRLLSFHQDDEDPSAFQDADLARLVFGNNQAFGEEKTTRFKAALSRFVEQYSADPIAARALHEWAQVVHGEDDYVKAHEIASRGMSQHPDSVGGRRCYNLIQQIEAPSAGATTERVWNDPWPTINVTYRNVERVYFRVVPFDFEEYAKSNRWSPNQRDQEQRKTLLATKPIKAWSAKLPKTEDYQERLEQVPVPTDVPSGSYFLISSYRDDFSEKDNQLSMTEIWVSKLALVLRTAYGKGTVEGFVLDAKTGVPQSDAVVRMWARNNRGARTELPTLRTDSNGLFQYKGAGQNGLLLHAAAGGDGLSSEDNVSTYETRNQPKTIEQTRFFTDRSIYRPGQSIRYKGICLQFNQTSNHYQTIANEDVTVVFRDVNGKEIETSRHRTNDYGSFSGSVTAPRDRLMGSMSLAVKGGPNGQTSIQVEEYKRPKFKVTIDPAKEAAKLGGLVKLDGDATAYSGAAIDDALVNYRVVREVRYPIWWSWSYGRLWFPNQTGGDQEITHGTARTDANGKFQVEFTATPDLSIPKESEPTFVYTTYVDVTDSAGETRSDERTVRVGYTALSAEVTADDWLTSKEPVELSIRTTSLDGEGQSAKGTIKVYSLIQPEKVVRPQLSQTIYARRMGTHQAPKDMSDPNSWELGDPVAEESFETDGAGKAKWSVPLEAGIYRVKLETRDRFGKVVSALLPIEVLDVDAKKFDIQVPERFFAQKDSVEPGETFRAVWGSGYPTARVFVEIEHRGKILKSFWSDPKTTQLLIEQPIDESMRGGLSVRTTMVRENRAYLNTRKIDVPWSNKKLTVEWEHFVSKLAPAAKETWTAIVRGPDAEKTAAEMVATLYDASLDAFQMHNWRDSFNVFYQDHSNMGLSFQNSLQPLQRLHYGWQVDRRDGTLTYRHYSNQIIQNLWGYQFGRQMRKSYAFGGAPRAESMNMGGGAPMPAAAMSRSMAADGVSAADESIDMADAEMAESMPADKQSHQAGTEAPGSKKLDLGNVSARSNMNETAFFFPHLIADDDGSVRIEFTMPEALTEWKFMGFAHDTELRAGLLTSTTVTAKDLMVQPNAPRFVREGDAIEFTVKVLNQSPTSQSGQVRLSFADARSGNNVDDALSNDTGDQSFDIPSGESRTLSWKIKVPEGIGYLTYKAVGSTGKLSDGEEGYLPVLSQRILVTESLPLPIRGKQTKSFEFEKLIHSGDSDTLRHQSLTLQVASNPSWYAVLALPYLMEYPHQCSEQTFNRLYANALARHIANSDPKIERIFEQWRGTPALDSPLEKNQDLKSVMLEETPWVRQADNESQARRNVAILFEQNRLDDETKRALFKLTEMQMEDGAWPWFPGGPANDYITLYITTGFGRMRHLGVDVDAGAAVRSLTRLDSWVTKRYNDIKPADRDRNHLSTTIAFYLYGRSFFLKDQAIAAEHREAVDYWIAQAEEHWLKLSYRQSQAHLAIALKRFGKTKPAEAIMRSIKERSVSDDEMGMYWRENELSWWWYRAPIETQAMMIEAFDEVSNDREAVEDCKVWLLKQKQTRDWKTTKATADAVYALLLRGSDLLASNELVQVELDGKPIEPTDVEAGTGFYQERFSKTEINPEMGNVTMRKLDDGVAWGSLHWQYFEDIAKVTPYEGTPLTLEKQLFVKKNTSQGPTLTAVDGPISVGDELVVRIVLRTDRDMEYVHMKDYRGSGTEPVNVLSSYKYQDGIGYYESTRDTATHFFIDYLAKGTYVFEYSTRVQLRGEYQTGLATIECMYAPEFNSHSESLPIVVK
ncbi:MG2 domain protein [Novipirellula aureliae]|uniref:MG2 domain protein n=1 Tax=Novipirellula aureliae TaxID=2527966 RepID=A0A5C6E830_9BACT|nr:alpha-2-macroglobulin family protein [Novipirellula aureliae]TWU43379.1 MG2 domain protein [Novipirellula aureliae]